MECATEGGGSSRVRVGVAFMLLFTASALFFNGQDKGQDGSFTGLLPQFHSRPGQQCVYHSRSTTAFMHQSLAATFITITID